MNSRIMLLTLFYGLLMFSGCKALLIHTAQMPEGRYLETCDVQQFRAFTFFENSFLEEQQRPHLELPVLYGKGVYKLSDSLLVLFYEPFSDDFNANIQYSVKDSDDEEVIIFDIRLRDRQSGKALTHADIYFKSEAETEPHHFRTGQDGNLYLEFDSVTHFNQLHIFYPFYQELFINIKQQPGNYHLLQVDLQAGVANRRESGIDTLVVHSMDADSLVLESVNAGYICGFVPEYSYRVWEKEVWKNFRNRIIPMPE